MFLIGRAVSVYAILRKTTSNYLVLNLNSSHSNTDSSQVHGHCMVERHATAHIQSGPTQLG